jgi:hypothetical protein
VDHRGQIKSGDGADLQHFPLGLADHAPPEWYQLLLPHCQVQQARQHLAPIKGRSAALGEGSRPLRPAGTHAPYASSPGKAMPPGAPGSQMTSSGTLSRPTLHRWALAVGSDRASVRPHRYDARLQNLVSCPTPD